MQIMVIKQMVKPSEIVLMGNSTLIHLSITRSQKTRQKVLPNMMQDEIYGTTFERRGSKNQP